MWLKRDDRLLNLNWVREAQWNDDKQLLRLSWGDKKDTILKEQLAQDVWQRLNEDVVEEVKSTGAMPEIGTLG